MPIVETLAASMARTLGLVVGKSRRARLMQRVRAYHALADELEAKDQRSAQELREVAAGWVTKLAQADRTAMARKVEAGVMFWYIVFLGGGVVGGYLAWTHLTGVWRAVVIVVCGLWVFFLGSAAVTSIFGSEAEVEGST